MRFTGKSQSESWRSRPAAHQPAWPDREELEAVLAELSTAPPVVTPRECDALRGRLARVARGEAFLLHGGDCAETLAGTTAESVRRKWELLLQMAAVLTYATFGPVVKVGRIAGQYAKPRSRPTETRDGTTLASYFGDAVNGHGFTAAARTPAPGRLRKVHRASLTTADLLRSLAAPSPRATEVFTSHEALLLDYEQALVRTDEETGRPYALSGHLLWIGERTRQPDGAHVEFAAGVANPVGVKLGPTATPEDVRRLLDRLDPERTPGRLTLIARMGRELVRDRLPELVECARKEGSPAVWVSDPMHGNTVEAPGGLKTRRFEDVLDEAVGSLDVHAGLGSHAGGLSLELTGEDVTECLGGSQGIAPEHLATRYESACDPRLNRGQAMDLAFHLAEWYRAEGRTGLPALADR